MIYHGYDAKDTTAPEYFCRKPFIYLDIPKTASTSVRSALTETSTWDLLSVSSDPFYNQEIVINGKKRIIKSRVNPKQKAHMLEYKLIYGKHTHMCELEEHIIKENAGPRLLKEVICDPTYFKFSIVRNPYDRLVSLFHYKAQVVKAQNRYKTPDQNIDDLKEKFVCFIKEEVQAAAILRQYRMERGSIMGCSVSSGEEQRLKKEIINYNYICEVILESSPMHLWVYNDSNQLYADYIGRFEHLRESIAHIFSNIDIKLKIDKFPHKYKSNHLGYEQYYTDELYEIVNKIYKEDFDRFDYEMKG